VIPVHLVQKAAFPAVKGDLRSPEFLYERTRSPE